MSDLIHSLGLDSSPIFSGGLALMVIGVVAAWLRRIPVMGMAAIRRRMVFSVEVQDRDMAFGWTRDWLAKQRFVGRVRDLTVVCTQPRIQYHSGGPPGHLSPQQADPPQMTLVPAPGIRLMWYSGRPVVVHYSRRDISVNSGTAAFHEAITFRFLGASRATIDAMMAEIQASAITEQQAPAITVWSPHPEGGWATAGGQHLRRPPESLALADGITEDVLDDLRRFQSSSRWYADRGVPYRRGYLLHGPPGTGKTTLAGILAGELGLSISVLSLADHKIDDQRFRRLLDGLPGNSILLLEDIDCVAKNRREGSQVIDYSGVTMMGLLNALDGIGAKDGRIMVMTSNHPERLDPALIRPGRVDRRIELGHATTDQAERMFRWFFRDREDCDVALLALRFGSILGDGVSPAAIQEHLIRHRDNPTGAASCILGVSIEVAA